MAEGSFSGYAGGDTRGSFFARTELLKQFNPTNGQAILARIAAERSRATHPERSLWEATALMVRDEIVRDQLLRDMTSGRAGGEADPKREKLFDEYRRILEGYRTLIELTDQGDRTLAEREILPHTRMDTLRLRLTDLLANQAFYFPEHTTSEGDKDEAFRRVSEAYNGSVQDGLQAEIALVGILRYGAEWFRGGVSGVDHLSPSVFVERTLPREDVLRPKNQEQRAGQFNGYDIIFHIPGEPDVSFFQLKTGVLQENPLHVNLPALELMNVYAYMASARSLREGGKGETPGVLEESTYHNVVEQLLAEFPINDAARAMLKRFLVPSRRSAARKEYAPRASWTVSLGEVKSMLEKDADFQRFAQTHDMPLSVSVQNFEQWSRFLVQARATHPKEPFWKNWPTKRKTKAENEKSLAL